MAIEIECKLSVPSHDPVRESLRAHGARTAGETLEVNHFFDRPDGSVRVAGCGLRVRELHPVERQTDSASRPGTSVPGSETAAETKAPGEMTFKGPQQAGPYKRREEIEVVVDDAAAACAILRSLGFEEVLYFEKRRERWQMGGCEVALDKVPHLGCFVEVEGPDETAIAGVLETLKLVHLPPVTATYAALLSEHCRAHGIGGRKIRFPS